MYRIVPEFASYLISEDGEVISMAKSKYPFAGNINQRKEKVVKPQQHKQGYLQVQIVDNQGNPKTVFIHRLVAKAFLGDFGDEYEVNHKNGCKNDNRLSNLEWVKPSENILHAFSNGLLKPMKGESNPMASITNEQAREVKRLTALGYSRQEISAQLNISFNVVKSIRAGRSYTNV